MVVFLKVLLVLLAVIAAAVAAALANHFENLACSIGKVFGHGDTLAIGFLLFLCFLIFAALLAAMIIRERGTGAEHESNAA